MVKITIQNNSIRQKQHWLKMLGMIFLIIIFSYFLFRQEIWFMVREVKGDLKPSDKNINQELKQKIVKLTKGYPIEKMASEIAKQDEEVAAFLVAIAKKESDWGRRTPKYRGRECYNYWGFRRKRFLMGSGGHTCFDNPKDAVDTVAERIENLIVKGAKTPREMVLWKCGNCTGPERIGAQKWIKDVAYYYSQIINN